MGRRSEEWNKLCTFVFIGKSPNYFKVHVEAQRWPDNTGAGLHNYFTQRPSQLLYENATHTFGLKQPVQLEISTLKIEK